MAVIRIEVAVTARSGWVIVVDTTLIPTAHVVGQLCRDSPDEKPERWKAWLWPKATTYPQRDQHCDAITGSTPEKLAGVLRKRLAAKGAWWTA